MKLKLICKNLLATVLAVSFATFSVLGSSPQIQDRTTGTIKSPKPGTVRINDSPVQNGGTVFSGAKIVTTESGVQITISGVGTVVLGANSTGTLSFDANGIQLVLTSGSGSVVTQKGKIGTLTDPTGKITNSDATLMSDILKYPNDGSRSPLAIFSGPRISTIGWVAIIGGGVAAVVIPVVLNISNKRP